MATPDKNASSPTTSPPVDPKERFFRYFQHEIVALQEQMERLGNTPAAGGERSDAIEHCLAGIARLSHEVKDASSYVPTYDQRTYGEAIKALSEKLQTTRTQLAPRAKFSFKNRKNPSAISLHDAAELAAQQKLKLPDYTTSSAASGVSSIAPSPKPGAPPDDDDNDDDDDDEKNGNDNKPMPEFPVNKNLAAAAQGGNGKSAIRKPSFSNSPSVTIANHTSQHIILPTSASHATSSGTLSSLKRCVVDMSQPTSHGGPFAALTLKNISSSLIICGQVSGSAHVTGLSGSVVVASCRQFRMHASTNVVVYLQCSSRPIIEDCEGIRFAPLPEFYVVQSVNRPVNMWDQVDDFKWLKAEQSPNWSILPDEERLKEGIWEGVVQGGPNIGLDQILEAVLRK
ncbi:tubulin-specific chaperone c [Pseudovirgaria hyperparasitica]|uniref:Tubulin-specific chaperone c n=1 Tax=Pseudovirgaria hyperparasitica TaxID=470096 RepID=A0A6A6W6I4_9PEZI|nr:tubulin-specific chaperone c [Pseudovirgaria hyperparasitica]KAF2758155.1 tubulin-specific chaperone c [Pseudovirgaria hyperparasitica]